MCMRGGREKEGGSRGSMLCVYERGEGEGGRDGGGACCGCKETGTCAMMHT